MRRLLPSQRLLSSTSDYRVRFKPSLLSNQYHGSRANTGGGIKSIDIAIARTDVDDSLISAIFVFLFFFPPGVMKSFLTMRNWKLMGAYVGVS
jgi:hypothetical protein